MKINALKRLVFLAVFLVLGTTAWGQPILRLPSIIGDHMVLQEKSSVRLWGWADPRTEVMIVPSWGCDTIRVKSGGDTRWNATVETPSAADTPYSIVFKTKKAEIRIDDVLIGQVWLCGGQSNMQWSAARGIADMKAELKKPMNPQLRLFTVTNNSSAWYQDDCVGEWKVCDSESAEWFSAVGYFFGKSIASAINQPVGLVNASWGGSPIETWIPASDMKKIPGLEDEWKKNRKSRGYGFRIGSMFNAMIYPITKMTLAGVIWYQGEANINNNERYADMFSLLIDSWRKRFKAELPFYFVQIAPYAKYKNEYAAAALREQQAIVAATKEKTGMVVVSDLVDDVNNIHPKYKQEVGSRLANFALAEVYGQNVGKYEHARFAEMKVKGRRAFISFYYADGGVTTNGKRVEALEICDESMNFVPASAIVDEGKGELIVWAESVKKPYAVRYAYSNGAVGNLKDAAGLPVAPFRTDGENPVPLEFRPAPEVSGIGVVAEGEGYQLRKFEKGAEPFLNRKYPISVLPEEFAGFDMLVRNVKSGELSQRCVVTPDADGVLYIVARKNNRTSEDLYGWREVKGAQMHYATSKEDGVMCIFSKKVKAGRQVVLPQTTDFGGIILIAKNIELR